MKRYALLILSLFLMAPLLPFAEPTDELNNTPNPSLSSGQYTVILYSDDKIVNLSSGYYHTCGILDNGSVSCWGNGMMGQLGNGGTGMQLSPTLTGSLGTGRTAVALSSGGYHTCAILDNGSVSCWGWNNYGQLGDGTSGSAADKYTPTQTSSLGANRTAVAISSGTYHTCVILDNGDVSCWGRGAYGQLGNGGTSNPNTPTLTGSLGAGRTAVALATGYYHTCAILDNGAVSCWGANFYGLLGNGGSSQQNSPTLTSSLGANRTAVAISSGSSIGFHTCAVLDNGLVSCWGSGGNGRLGNGGTSQHNSPTLTSSLGANRTAVAISSGGQHTCAILDNGKGVCWGQGAYGQMGNGLNSNYFSPTPRETHHLSVLEGQSITYDVKGSIFDNIDINQFSINFDAPVGLTFDQTNLSITGSPNYTAQTQWNLTIINGTQQRTATYSLQVIPDTDGDGEPNSLDTDDDGDGYADLIDVCPTQFGNSTVDVLGCSDADGDGYSNSGDSFANDATQFADSDQDGFGDNASGTLPDGCPSLYGDSSRGGLFGCPDSDDDRWADQIDDFVNDLSQWNDSDGDGFGDSLVGFQGDACPTTIGTSTQDRFGCLDADGDGWSDDGDLFSNNPTQWVDRDGDGYGDNQSETATMSDKFPADGTQWNDSDGDDHGDNPYGTQGDWFPYDSNRWQDSDADGVADEDDAFYNENSQSEDRDGDGYGDNPNGKRADQFTDDPLEWADSDSDGLGNNADAFPFDPSQQTDADGDGFGDNEKGSGADKFPNDSTQWSDIDGDGFGDNQDGNTPDAFITDSTQWADADGDGFGDNSAGRQADAFTNDATQWIDQDGDGLGDNQSGNNPDPYLFDFDNDGYNDSVDSLPKLASPGDLDNDGKLDLNDAFPEDFREWADADGDGEGNNADTDDDNDGWTDIDELREGTNPFSNLSQPVNSFEMVIPGTSVGLGAWDLIGMFGGIPLFCWIGFGFVSRNKRAARYEQMLRNAESRDKLEDVAHQWEYSLMLRLLGPHQGIRLERLRAELDDYYEAQNQRLSSIEPEEYDQTEMVEQSIQGEQKALDVIDSSKLLRDAVSEHDEKGYE